ncbi:MAG: HEAT repeat domain-containing protein [Bacteroidales bacterium]|nr:HEAT repeat domain-containing protein [Bacteroidales bacterium]
MSNSLLVESFEKLPQPRPGDDPDLLRAGVQEAMCEFRDVVLQRYTEGTLQRLLLSGDTADRRAAVMGLALIGTMKSNPILAQALHDPDCQVRSAASDAVWDVWFRGGNRDQNWQLQRALLLNGTAEAIAALDELIQSAPEFAEAYNQRAILHYRRGEFAKAVADCEITLRLNPVHFGAASGMGQCYLHMNRPRAALRAFRQALAIFPDWDEVKDRLRDLENTHGESE